MSDTIIKCRPSSMPRAFHCPSSLALAKAPVRISSDESDLGHATHVALAYVAHSEEPDLDSIARTHGIDKDDLEPMVAYGRKAWGDIGKYFPSVMTEKELDSDLGNGTTDLMGCVTSDKEDEIGHRHDLTITIGDWKSGRNRREYRRQMQAYAYAARYSLGMPDSGKITAITVWLRFFEIDVLQFTDADLDNFRAEFVALTHNIGKAYAPGEYCVGCQRAHECPARDNFLRSAQTALVSATEDGIAPARLAELYPQAQALEKMLEAYRVALKLALASGPLPIGGGKQIELVEARRCIIDPLIARPVLTANGFSDADIAQATTISKGTLETIIGDRAPRGMKGKNQAALIHALEGAGAITLQTYTKLQQTKI